MATVALTVSTLILFGGGAGASVYALIGLLEAPRDDGFSRRFQEAQHGLLDVLGSRKR
jgi:hypothetical protein